MPAQKSFSLLYFEFLQMRCAVVAMHWSSLAEFGKKHIKFYTSAGIVTLLLWGLFPVHCVAKVYGILDIMNPAMHNICALTFDDGPHPFTPKVLRALQEENVKATFFVLGLQVEYFPHTVKRIYAQGHEIANHAYSHRALTDLTHKEIYKEINKTNELLRHLGVPKPRFLRPPLGAYNGVVIKVLNQLGMDLVLWSTDSYDWQGRPDYTNMPNMLNENMTKKTQRGVYLFHDTKKVTAQDAKRIVQELRSMGCQRFVTISDYFSSLASPQVMAKVREKTAEEKAREEKIGRCP